ncbi:hypothetical protein ABZS86_28360 [Streptomyces sp. NPDC005355]|uniref:hypothetical protein n=1 Tax=Streptomyces sp. NPDC005355 TaxID=3157038 RepID=UPI0033B9B480
MAGKQLPEAVEEFAGYLRALTRRLDPGAGWYGVFAQRDPDGLQACLDGHEVPPWDVVQALLQDLSAQCGPEVAQEAAARAAALYRASVAAHDAGPGAREALRDRLDAMLREQRYAAARERDLETAARFADDAADRESLTADLAWAHDDRQRATARCEELRARLEALPHSGRPSPAPEGWFRDAPRPAPAGTPRGARFEVGPGNTSGAAGDPPDAASGRSGPHDVRFGGAPGEARPRGGGPGGPAGSVGAPTEADAQAPDQPAAVAAPAPRSMPRGARFAGVEEVAALPRPRGARFAGAEAGDSGEAVAPPPALGAEASATPRGARFAGAYGGGDGPKRRKRGDTAEEDGQRLARDAAARAEARRAAEEAVARLGRLRAAGRSGEAHVVLCETAAWPAPRLPVLAAELERAGLGADLSTLLWEMACLPPAPLAAAAEALVAADRAADGERLLRQSVARPVPEVAHTALALLAADAADEAAFLLGALVRARTPDETAQAAAEDPATLVPLLLDVARGVSSGSHHDLAHALRVAGLPGVPGVA